MILQDIRIDNTKIIINHILLVSSYNNECGQFKATQNNIVGEIVTIDSQSCKNHCRLLITDIQVIDFMSIQSNLIF